MFNKSDNQAHKTAKPESTASALPENKGEAPNPVAAAKADQTESKPATEKKS